MTHSYWNCAILRKDWNCFEKKNVEGKLEMGRYSGDWHVLLAEQRLQAFPNNASVLKKIKIINRQYSLC